jgi:hypothetical protein
MAFSLSHKLNRKSELNGPEGTCYTSRDKMHHNTYIQGFLLPFETLLMR